jgi:hypothetical protein
MPILIEAPLGQPESATATQYDAFQTQYSAGLPEVHQDFDMRRTQTRGTPMAKAPNEDLINATIAMIRRRRVGEVSQADPSFESKKVKPSIPSFESKKMKPGLDLPRMPPRGAPRKGEVNMGPGGYPPQGSSSPAECSLLIDKSFAELWGTGSTMASTVWGTGNSELESREAAYVAEAFDNARELDDEEEAQEDDPSKPGGILSLDADRNGPEFWDKLKNVTYVFRNFIAKESFELEEGVTIMLRDVPSTFVVEPDLMDLISNLSSVDVVDYIYLPMVSDGHKEKVRNKGYSFFHFRLPEAAHEFLEHLQHQKADAARVGKRMVGKFAKFQGISTNLHNLLDVRSKKWRPKNGVVYVRTDRGLSCIPLFALRSLAKHHALTNGAMDQRQAPAVQP